MLVHAHALQKDMNPDKTKNSESSPSYDFRQSDNLVVFEVPLAFGGVGDVEGLWWTLGVFGVYAVVRGTLGCCGAFAFCCMSLSMRL